MPDERGAVPEGIEVTETSRVFKLPVAPEPRDSQRYWKWGALILSVILGAGALAGAFGQAFYVTRPEYTQQSQNDAVARENMRGTLERLDKTLNVQAEAFRDLANEVQSMKVDVAVLHNQKNR
jgi:hypothetical protein